MKIILIDTCALLDRNARECVRREVFLKDESNTVVLLSKVKAELQLKQKSEDIRIQSEARGALNLCEQEYPGRIEHREYARPKGLPDDGFKADEEIEYCCQVECSKGNSVELYTLDNPLAFKLTQRLGVAGVSVRIPRRDGSCDYSTVVLPDILGNLQEVADKYNVYVTSGAIMSRGFRFCMNDLGFARMLNKAGGRLYVLSCTRKLLSPAVWQGMNRQLKPQVVEIAPEDPRDEFQVLTDLLTVMKTDRRSLLLCGAHENSQYCACCQQRRFLPQHSMACVVALMGNSGQIVTPDIWKRGKHKSPHAKPAAPASSPKPRAAAVLPKVQVEKAVKRKDLHEVAMLLDKGGNPLWALMACVQIKECADMLPDLLALIGSRPVGSDLFRWVVDKYLPGVWLTSKDPWREVARVLPLLLQVVRHAGHLHECGGALARLKRWCEECTEEAVKALLDRVLQVATA